jgi:hypothetical protein
VYLLADNIDIVHKNTETLVAANKEVGLEINEKKNKVCCCLITRMHVTIYIYLLNCNWASARWQ